MRGEWHAKTMALVRKHQLGFIFNPGGGAFNRRGCSAMNPTCPSWDSCRAQHCNLGDCQVATMDDRDDYEKLLAWLRAIGVEPPEPQ